MTAGAPNTTEAAAEVSARPAAPSRDVPPQPPREDDRGGHRDLAQGGGGLHPDDAESAAAGSESAPAGGGDDDDNGSDGGAAPPGAAASRRRCRTPRTTLLPETSRLRRRSGGSHQSAGLRRVRCPQHLPHSGLCRVGGAMGPSLSNSVDMKCEHCRGDDNMVEYRYCRGGSGGGGRTAAEGSAVDVVVVAADVAYEGAVAACERKRDRHCPRYPRERALPRLRNQIQI